MNQNTFRNYKKHYNILYLFPLILFFFILFFLYKNDYLSANNYIEIQKNWFFFINSNLSQYPSMILNLTQFGDAFFFLCCLTVLIIIAPKIWDVLLTSLCISSIICTLLKKIFHIPRPAAVFNHNSFMILGKSLTGHNSLPSGHTTTIFTVLTILLFGFMPQKREYRIIFIILTYIIGYLLSFTRVGVGAHYTLDVIIGSFLGFSSALLGILLCQKLNLWIWMTQKKFYPLIIILLLFCLLAFVYKLFYENLIIFCLPLSSLIVSIYLLSNIYAKK